MSRPVYLISGDQLPELKEVGGKGLSLIKMMQHGLPVPDGFILTVEFFLPWFDELKNQDEWQAFKVAGPDQIAARCQQLKQWCDQLSFTPEQAEVVEDSLSGFTTKLWAVRSSSPEEDLSGASFAGGYETVLGVKSETLEDAIKVCFASSLDYRVYMYKQEHGFIPDDPKIAVVIQQQIPSEIAGVGFSLNPMNNCYDQAVFNANWGQGETVVSGLVAPDNFVVDKISHQLLEQDLGGKETSIWLGEDGGTEERPAPNRDEFTLTEPQLVSLTAMVTKVEQYYQKPMDIEWAFAANELYLLQARPITTYIPLPAELLTLPGEPLRLYFDLTLGIQGIHDPVSIMGNDWLNSLFATFATEIFGQNLLSDPETGILSAQGGRLYANLSRLLQLIPQDAFAKAIGNMDSITSDTIKDLDLTEYLQEPLPKQLHGIIRKALLHIPDTFAKIVEGQFLPKLLEKNYLRNEARYQTAIRRLDATSSSLADYSHEIMQELMRLIVHTSIPAVASFFKAQNGIQRMFADDTSDTARLVSQLTSSLPHNVTVEMGLALYRLAQLLPPEESDSPATAIIEKINQHQLPEDFLHAWDDFMTKYGFRGPCELDLSAPRYRERPETIITQLQQLFAADDPERNPQLRYDQAQTERHQAYEELSEKIHQQGWLKLKRFQRLFHIEETLGGYRESHKYNVIMGNDLVRRHALNAAEVLVADGRLDHPDEIFNLKVTDVDEAIQNPSLDLRERLRERTQYWQKIEDIKNFPRLITSRGTILRPPRREAAQGELIGKGVSPGVARGPVKVLHSSDEKPILPGDILVTRATDPGWTPLFINAAAVVLEVGGMLQHGALVAREYGKPCVVGIDNIATILKDGQQIEVDGSNGIIKLISD